VLSTSGQLQAQHFRGGFRKGFHPSFNPALQRGFTPNFGFTPSFGFTPRFQGVVFDPRLNRARFDPIEDRMENRFRFGVFDRIEDRLENRLRGRFVPGFGFVPGLRTCLVLL
jgi:hypothetical protein